jgi:hypothetical protein
MQMISIIMILFAIFAYIAVILKVRKDEITKGEFAFWSLLWIGVVVVALIPSFATTIADFFGIGRGVDVMIYLSILTLFYLVFRIFVKLEKLEQEMTMLVRKLAIETSKKKLK